MKALAQSIPVLAVTVSGTKFSRLDSSKKQRPRNRFSLEAGFNGQSTFISQALCASDIVVTPEEVYKILKSFKSSCSRTLVSVRISPISITTPVVKVLEKVIRDKLATYFSKNRMIPIEQHGFL
ncbi:hypothetical protein COOONC_25114 [Cooperia oncophora]